MDSVGGTVAVRHDDACHEMLIVIPQCLTCFYRDICAGIPKTWADFASYTQTSVRNKIWKDRKNHEKRKPSGGMDSLDAIEEASMNGETINSEVMLALSEKKAYDADELGNDTIYGFSNNLGTELLAWFESLKPLQQKIVYLRTVGFSFAKIASVIGDGMTENAVKKAFYRSKLKLEQMRLENLNRELDS